MAFWQKIIPWEVGKNKKRRLKLEGISFIKKNQADLKKTLLEDLLKRSSLNFKKEGRND